MSEPGEALRLDKWLWYARFFKTRSLATKLVRGGRLRLNKQAIDKPHAQVRIGDVLTFPQGHRVRVVKIAALASRRGPAPEAQALYEDLSPPAPRAPGRRAPGTGRPTKRERRELESFREP